jgi:hypothetical protein
MVHVCIGAVGGPVMCTSFRGMSRAGSVNLWWAGEPTGGRHQSDVTGRGVLGGGQHMLGEPVPCLPGGWQ